MAENRKHTYEYVKQEIEKRGGTLLSTEYVGTKQKLEIICKDNHTFWICFGHIIGGYWCQECGGSKKLTYEYIKQEVEKRGGILISKEYKNNKTKLEIICKNNHTFWVSYNDIRAGCWCPECSFHKTQKQLTETIREIFPNCIVLSDFTKFDWLRTRGKKRHGKLELDIYIPELKLAIEYQGEQHYKPTRFGGISQEKAEENFTSCKYRDRLKVHRIKQHPEDIICFIKFHYKEKKKLTKEYVIGKIKKSKNFNKLNIQL